MYYRKKAFTLIELLVVIAIIALLLSILMPSLQMAKDKAKEVICRSNLKQWGLCAALYAEDNDGKMMIGWMEGGPDWGLGKQWMNQLRPYYSGIGDFRLCPKTKRPEQDWWFGGVFDAWADLTGTPGSAIVKGDYGSYAMNDWMHNPLKLPPGSLWPGGSLPGSKYSDYWLGPYYVTTPHNVPFFYDSMWTGTMPHHTNPAPDYEGIMIWNFNEQMNRNLIRRHGNKGINMSFVDQHVELVSLKRHWKLKWHKGFDTHHTYGRPNAPWPDWMRSIPEN